MKHNDGLKRSDTDSMPSACGVASMCQSLVTTSVGLSANSAIWLAANQEVESFNINSGGVTVGEDLQCSNANGVA